MSAFITHIATFLPNAPVDNDTMESVLGQVNGRRSRARALVLRNNGIKRRHYAIDPATGQLTHTNAQLTAEAVRRVLAEAKLDPERLALLACGTSTPDQLLPQHAAMVHGELELPPCEIMTGAGACTASMTAFKYATMAVASGLARNAVAAGSELCSALMRADFFTAELDERVQSLEKNPHIAFEHEFLRWMLSDGAGAVLIEPQPREQGALPSLRIHWVEAISFAGQLDVCMYHLARKRADGTLETWKQVKPSEWLEGGFHRMGQDARMLAEHIGPFMGDAFKLAIERRGLRPGEVHWLLPHISSAFFHGQIREQSSRAGLPFAEDRVFTNLSTVGNVGAASVFLMLEELLRSGRAKKGERILCVVPESARFNATFVLLEVV